MQSTRFEFQYEVYNDISELNRDDAGLLLKARELTRTAYAPYSNFHVGAVALLANGNVVTGTNQENAAYPVGICAERVLLGTVGTSHKDVPIITMAISYDSPGNHSDHPISPCGMCRQALLEYEKRTSSAIRLILGGQSGLVFIISKASQLLPFAFSSEELGS